MFLSCLVARHEKWKQFSTKWSEALVSGKPLERHKGSIYFKSFEAETLSGCFRGFTRLEADERVDLLTDIALDHILYGVVAGMRWKDFTDVVQGQIIKPKGRLIASAKHPYDFCFHALLAAVLNEQANRKMTEEIDFAFDKQGKLLRRCIQWYDENKKHMPDRIRGLVGQIIPGDDKIVLPIQAADLVAWQSRNASWPHTGRKTNSVKKIVEAKKLYKRPISKPELLTFIGKLNTAHSTAQFLQSMGVPIKTSDIVHAIRDDILKRTKEK
jgi:hypothetical protein